MKKVVFCPMCRSTNVSFDARLEIVYPVCKNCGFRSIGMDFPHKIVKKSLKR
ncbi:MAG: hypothetical protein ABIB47_04975 [Candidatus Woesearchaeota archaeon]